MRKSALTVIATIAPFAIMAANPAQADTLSASGIFSQFNAVIFGPFKSTADVEGRTVVGGDLIGGATFDLNPAHVSASAFAGLTVYGSATASGNYNINNGGGVTIAGSNSVSFTLNSGGAAFVGGTNSGNFNVSNGTGGLAIGGTNRGTLQISSGGSVYIGGRNSGGINANSSATVKINGDNSANVNLNGGGAVSLNGSNSGTISLNGGTFTYTGQQGNANLNGGATAMHVDNLPLPAPASTLPSFADTFQTPLTNLSAQLDAQTANSLAAASSGNVTFNARPNASGIAIFHIDSSLLAPNSTVTLNLNGVGSVIINVNVDSCVSNACVFSLPDSLHFANPTSYAEHVLWNFVNATGLTFPTEIGGSILAPLATVRNNAPIDGTLVAASYVGDGELHSHPYSGSLPDGPFLSPPGDDIAMPVPEPASLALVASGLVGLTIRRRRPGQRMTTNRSCDVS